MEALKFCSYIQRTFKVKRFELGPEIFAFIIDLLLHPMLLYPTFTVYPRLQPTRYFDEALRLQLFYIWLFSTGMFHN